MAMENPSSSATDHGEAPRAPLRLGRTLRFGFKTAWDSLGFVCASSLTLFAAFCLALSPLGLIPYRPLAVVLALVAWLLLIPPIYAGICWLAHKVYEHDEPSYGDLWTGFRTLYTRAVALGAVQIFVSVVLMENIWFYLSRKSTPFLLLAVVFAYGLLFWAMNQMYHWPLLVATEAGIIRREDGRPSGLTSVLRNAFVLTMSGPGYTFAILLLLIALAIPLVVSGVGLALLLPAAAAFVTTQATRDQLVRFGVMEAPPDPDEPIKDERWRVQ